MQTIYPIGNNICKVKCMSDKDNQPSDFMLIYTGGFLVILLALIMPPAEVSASRNISQADNTTIQTSHIHWDQKKYLDAQSRTGLASGSSEEQMRQGLTTFASELPVVREGNGVTIYTFDYVTIEQLQSFSEIQEAYLDSHKCEEGSVGGYTFTNCVFPMAG